MSPLLLVAAGGAVGAAARYLTGRALSAVAGPALPWGTLTVNLLGGLLMGALSAALARLPAGEAWRLALGVGVLGGFTTFSAFSLEVVTMIERGAMLLALGYALISVVGAVLALFAGLFAVRALA